MSTLIQELIESIYSTCEIKREGKVYAGARHDQIDPETFGVCISTADGELYEVGDTRVEFPIQSISKPFTYGLALSDRGIEAVDRKIDVEPSGELYNEISLEPSTRRPRNPMINAGAIVAASMVDGQDVASQSRHLQETFSAYAGRKLDVDQGLLRKQLRGGHRNRAIGHMLREFEILEDNPDHAHEVYLSACSTMVTCRDLAQMGAVWANGGVQPLTGKRLLDVGLLERVLSVMATCGMYDDAGRWVAEVGMPAKSGVSGGIVAVLPGQLSIAAMSPRLDEHGNSVRAFEACRRLSERLELHTMHAVHGARGAIRDSYDIRTAPSTIQRPEADLRLLEEHGERARIYELHGDLFFSGAESVVREITRAGPELDLIAVDVRGIGDTSKVARELLANLRTWLRQQICEGFVIDPNGRLPPPSDDVESGKAPTFSSIAAATRYFEDRLLRRYGDHRAQAKAFDLDDHPTLLQAPDGVLGVLRRRTTHRTFAEGETIIVEGDDQAGLFFLLSGRVRSSLTTMDGHVRDVATLTPGTSFGLIYVMTGNPHALAVRALTEVEVFELTREQLAEIADTDHEAYDAILEIFLQALHNELGRSLRSVAHARVAPMTGT